MAAGPEHERIYANLIGRSGVAISAGESWVLWHVGALGPITAQGLAAELHVAGLGRSGWGPGGRRFKSCLPDSAPVPPVADQPRQEPPRLALRRGCCVPRRPAIALVA